MQSKTITKILALAFTAAAFAAAQPLGVGLKVGAPFNDVLNAANGQGTLVNNATKFTIGPMVELRFPFGVGVEADLLYRRVDGSFGSSGVSAGVTANSWTIPVLLKYRLGFPVVKPYVEAGPSFRKITNANYSFASIVPVDASTLRQHDQNTTGFTVGAGVELKLLLIRIAPELRYTRWGSSAFTIGNLGTTLIDANKNQAEFLVGITF